MASRLLQSQRDGMLAHIARFITASTSPLSPLEQQIHRLLAEQKSAAETQAEAVASARIGATRQCLREVLRLVDAIDSLDTQLSESSERNREKANGTPHKSVNALMKRLRETRDSVRAIRSLADNVLTSLGAERIEPKRLDVFDSTIHNAIKVTEDPNLPSNIVCETLQAGLKHIDTVIRPAQVVINDVY